MTWVVVRLPDLDLTEAIDKGLLRRSHIQELTTDIVGIEEVVGRSLTSMAALHQVLVDITPVTMVADIKVHFEDLVKAMEVDKTHNSCYFVVAGQPANLIGEAGVPSLRRPKFDFGCSFLYNL